jgi:CubicO group peptidase (beta-lactamase class C family)
VTKSVTTTLVGIAADQGKLRLDDPVLSFFPDRAVANRDARKERVTVAHLASMTSGLDCVATPDEPTLAEMTASADWVQFTLDRPMVAEPGTTFSYCSPGMHLLSAVLTRATGMSELDFARQNLFEPLGIRDVVWPVDPQGFNHGWGDVYLYPRDAAKLGYRMSPGNYGFAIGQRGYWADATTFVLDRDEIANRNANLIRMRFEGDTVAIDVKERTHVAGVQIRGRVLGS